jgi:hypothetical protein
VTALDGFLKEIRDYWWFAALLIIAAKTSWLWLLAIPAAMVVIGLIAAANSTSRSNSGLSLPQDYRPHSDSSKTGLPG